MKTSRLCTMLCIAILLASLFGPGASPALAGGEGTPYTVNGTGDASDINIGDDICATATGKCTLRAAIQESNVSVNTNLISFNIAGTGIRRITLSSVLPIINFPVIIDGSTQLGCSLPCIELDGSALPGAITGLAVHTYGTTIRGLIVTGFYNPSVVTYGIELVGNTNTLQGNYIGVRPGDAVAHPNGTGIAVQGSFNYIGGYMPTDRNVISGNNQQGILLGSGGGAMNSTTIIGNYIGTNPAGTGAMGNGGSGINIQFYVTNTLIGAVGTGGGNVISGNGWNGINIMGSGNTIIANYIGTKADGTGSIPNHFNGIQLYGLSTDNIIGGTVKNRIAHNGENGIAISSEGTGRTTIKRNLIYSNGLLGIDLHMNGVTTNDVMDVDGGANGLQNFPQIVSATSSTSEIIVKLYSKASTTYKIEFYSSPAGTCDASGYGEGRRYLGSKLLTTDTSGYGRIRFVAAAGFTIGTVITTTATDDLGNTSEFSHCKTAQ